MGPLESIFIKIVIIKIGIMKTIIIIAHRLTVINRCDRVVSLEKGLFLEDE